MQILKVSGLLTTAGDALARPAGQTSARWQVLAAAEHGPATVAQMARMLGLARQSVQRVANLLVAEGLAHFGDNPNDKRADLLSLTDTGLEALKEIQERQKVWADALGKAVGEAKLLEAFAVLESVTKALEKQ